MKLIVALCGGASLLAIAPAAFAQQATPTADTVVVTGSRIVRNGYAAPTPVTVAPAAQLEALTPSNIPDALNKLPVFSGSQTSTTTTGVPGNYLNLRNFGINRTLILVDGLRAPPTNAGGQVDTNTIPQMLLQRVDVVTGGASAVYGSDAVTGVVNFIMDNHFNGLKLQAQAGISGHGDAASTRYGIAAGGDLFNLGHFEGSYEHFQEGGLLHEQRDYAAARPATTGSGTAASPYVLITNSTIPLSAFGGYVSSGPFAGQQFLANGQLGPYNPGTATGSSRINSGGDGAYYNQAILADPQNENQLYGRFDRDLTSSISGFVDVSASWSDINVRNNNWPGVAATYFPGNPFLPASAQAQLAPCAATTCKSFNVTLFPRDLELQAVQTQATSAISVTAGLKGKFLDNYNWELSYTHGADIFRQSISNNINVPNFLAAIDAVSGPSGPVCNNASLFPGCAPLNVFGVGNESPAALAYIYQTTSSRLVNYFDDYVSSISGSPFNDWAGPVSVALNAEYRQQALAETTNANPNALPNLTGLRDYNTKSPPATVYAYATTAPVSASNSVWEVSGETVIPLLKDMTFAKSLNITGAVRYTDYSTSGSVVTWKAGLDYQPINDVRIRATESRDIRAPTLIDLFAGQSSTNLSLNDPHTNTSNVVTVISRGNPNLVPEVSTTTTVGLVYSPSWLPRFRMSVDYYDITMNNAITSQQGVNPTILLQCEAVQWTSPLCGQLIVRPLPFSNTTAANFPTAVYTENVNVSKAWTQGVDIEASYNLPLDEVSRQLSGNANFRLLYSYQPIDDAINFPGSGTINASGTVGTGTGGAVPAHRITFMADYERGPFGLDWQTRYSTALKRTSTPGLIFAGNDSIPDYTISDLNLTYRFKVDSHAFNMFFNIQNVFDVQPRIANSTTLSGIPGFGDPAPATDDLFGRYFTVGLKFNY